MRPYEPTEPTRTRRTSQHAQRQRQQQRSGRMRDADRRRRKSVGATTISAPGARAIGLARNDSARPHGRGETARRVEAAREESVRSRPAVYTAEPERKGFLSRIKAPSLSLPHLESFSVPIPLLVVIALAIAIAIVAGPVRNYYIAWRESGVLAVEYEALASQNDELSHEIDRLQTLEGIEDEARERGYVYPDEEAVIVEGVVSDDPIDPALVDQAVEEYEKDLPWYVGILDFVFGYTHE